MHLLASEDEILNLAKDPPSILRRFFSKTIFIKSSTDNENPRITICQGSGLQGSPNQIIVTGVNGAERLFSGQIGTVVVTTAR